MSAASIKAWRRACRFTQAEAAEYVGVHMRSWNRWETGSDAAIPKAILLALFGPVTPKPPAYTGPLGSDYG